MVIRKFLQLTPAENMHTKPVDVGQVHDILSTVRQKMALLKDAENERRKERNTLVNSVPQQEVEDEIPDFTVPNFLNDNEEEAIEIKAPTLVPEILTPQVETQPKLEIRDLMTGAEIQQSFLFLQNFFSDAAKFLKLKQKYEEVKGRIPEGKIEVENEKTEIEKGDLDELLTEDALKKLLERGGSEKSKEILNKISQMLLADYRESITNDKEDVEDRLTEIETGHSRELAELVSQMEKYQKLADPKVIENISILIEVFHATKSSTVRLAESLRVSHRKSMEIIDETEGKIAPQDILMFISSLEDSDNGNAGRVLLDILVSRFGKN